MSCVFGLLSSRYYITWERKEGREGGCESQWTTLALAKGKLVCGVTCRSSGIWIILSGLVLIKSFAMEIFAGQNFMDKHGDTVPAQEVLTGKKVLALYFSAHW